MTNHQYDADVPVPASRGGRGRGANHSISLMPAGMSKFYPCERFDGQTDEEYGKARKRIRANLQNRCSEQKKAHGRVYTMRTVTENGIDGFRVWRLS